MNFEAFSYTNQHKLTLELKAVKTSELDHFRNMKHPVYFYQNQLMQKLVNNAGKLNKEHMHVLKKNGIDQIFIHQEDENILKKNRQLHLIKVSRSLSIGNPLENGKKLIKLLTLNLRDVYENPHDDQLLKLQFQNTQNFGQFLLNHKKLQKELYLEIEASPFFYIQTQPMLSSILLLSFLESLKVFTINEIENLYLTSYFKDFGFSIIPKQKFHQDQLNKEEHQLISAHPRFSYDLLSDRISLPDYCLNIIRNHHFLNDKLKSIIGVNISEENQILHGLESTLVDIFDMLVAMISNRPYRKATNLFTAMEIIKKIMADDHPQEYRFLVLHINQFFKN